MDESGTFEKLVRELDPVERQELLKKLTPAEIVSAEPLIRKEPEQEIDLEKEYYSLGLISRLVIFFHVVFAGEDKFQLTEDLVLKKLERELKRDSGEIVSLKNGQLLEDFLTELVKLHEASRFFSGPINAVWRHNRDEFLNFLGSFQIPIIHKQLEQITDFELTEKSTGFKNPVDVRKEVFLNVESNLAKITGDLRKSMYLHSKTVSVLSELIDYDYKSTENLFSKKNDKLCCYFGDARAPLDRLTNVLSSLRVSPDQQLLEAMFLFMHEDLKVKDENFIQAELKNFFHEAKENLKKIREFNLKVQPAKLMKLVTGNIGYHSKPVSGGEDWFNLYSKYWYTLAESRYKKYSAEKRREKIFKDMQMYFKKDEMPVLEYYKNAFKFSCGFLNVFIRDEMAVRMNGILKKILVDGRFYKKQNKEGFTDSYSLLMGLYEKFRKFDAKSAKGGAYKIQIDDAGREMVSESLRAKKVASVVEQADFEAKELLDKGLEGLLLLKNILYGILHGKAGGQFDSLSNLNGLVTSESRDFIIDLNETYTKIDDAYRILGDIIALEEVG
ncbi:MAG: hypothetical protein JEZ04_09200 [Spirochaetales bacterium]|nr:hypothetical protein [Spirochaetales bacterium]